MRRTQLYLDDEMWKALHVRSRRQRRTVSELVRQALREKYARVARDRAQAMARCVGLWQDRDDLPGTDAYLRRLRQGRRLARLR